MSFAKKVEVFLWQILPKSVKRTKPFDQLFSKFVEVMWPKELIILVT